jgi:hypothetical protein
VLENKNKIVGRADIDEQGAEVFGPSFTVIHRTIPGLAILSSSRLFASEASAILRLRLHTLSTQPIQIITNTLGLGADRLENLICSSWLSEFGLLRDIRHALKPDYLAWLHLPNAYHTFLPKTSSRTIHIAIRKHFSNYCPGRFSNREATEIDESRMNLLQKYYGYLRLTTFTVFTKTVGRKAMFMFVCERLCCQNVAYRSVEPWAEEFLWPVSRRGPTLHIDSGEPIKEIEWKDEWAGGKRYFQSI